MFLYEKKIVYLSHYAQGTRTASAGFVRALGEHGGCMLDIHIKGGGQMPDGDYPLFLLLRTRKIPWGTVAAKDGSVRTGRRISLKQKRAFVEGESFPEEDLCGVLVLLDYGQQIAGYWKQPDASVLSWENQEEKKGREAPAETEIHVAAREVPAEGGKTRKTAPQSPKTDRPDPVYREEIPQMPEISADNTLEDKWQQLQRCYKRVHPFGDERVFVSIEPKDFIILHSSCQKLVNNSFLLHGYYNYRHLILGPDRELGSRYKTCYYLGVPGAYFEREKMVAVMFGFEGFECSGAVEIGKFGYYMRRVEL